MQLNNFEAKVTIFADENIISRIIGFLRRSDFDENSYVYYVERTLTEREIEVLKLVIDGKSNNEIGKILHISSHTVKAHISSILEKLCVQDRIQAAVKATKENLI